MKTIGKKALQVTSVLQYAGLKALALKVSSFLVAKKSFRFHFFCNLVSGKLFLLSAVFNRTFRCKSPHIAKPFPVVCYVTKNFADKQISEFLNLGRN